MNYEFKYFIPNNLQCFKTRIIYKILIKINFGLYKGHKMNNAFSQNSTKLLVSILPLIPLSLYLVLQ